MDVPRRVIRFPTYVDETIQTCVAEAGRFVPLGVQVRQPDDAQSLLGLGLRGAAR